MNLNYKWRDRMKIETIEDELTVKNLEKELANAKKKLDETEKLIEAVNKELEPSEVEVEKGGNCCEDFDDEEEK